MRRHASCPTCCCEIGEALVIDRDAPFWPLVAEADRLIYGDYIGRRTATRRTNLELRRQLRQEAS